MRLRPPAAPAAPASAITRVGFAPITRIDHGNREIELCATSEAVDTYGTIFAYEASRDAFDRWAGNVREMHERKAVGRRVAVRCDDAARRIFVRVRISRGAADTWEKICDGTLRGASIGASNVAWVTEQRMGRDLPVAHRYDLVELSLVDLPSNPDALGVAFVRDGVPQSDLLDELPPDMLPDPQPAIPATPSTSPYSQVELWGSILDSVSAAPEQARVTAAPAGLARYASDPANDITLDGENSEPGVEGPASEDGDVAATEIALVSSHGLNGADSEDGVDADDAEDATDAATSEDVAAGETTSAGTSVGTAPDQPRMPLPSHSPSAPVLPPPSPPTPAPNMTPRDPATVIAAAALNRGLAALSSTQSPAQLAASPSGSSPRAWGEAGREDPHTAARAMLQNCGCAACQRALAALTGTPGTPGTAGPPDDRPAAARGSLAGEPAAPTPTAGTAHEQRTLLALDTIERRLAVLEAQPMPGGPQLRFADKTHPLQPTASFGGQPSSSDQFRALAALAGKLTDHQAQLAVATELIRLQQEAAGLSPNLQAMPRAGSGALPGTRSS